MKYRQLGNSGIEVSVITLGCWSLIGDANWGQQNRDDSLATIDAALEQGINFLDTAPGYGNGESEALLGEALKGRREQVVIADKVLGLLSRKRIFSECEKSLELLQTDYIDLYQIHWPDRETPFEETFTALDELVEQGKIRSYGISNFGPVDLKTALDIGAAPVTNQMPYSLLWRGLEYELLPLCEDKAIGILSYSSLMQGLLTGKFHCADEVPEGRARTRHFASTRGQTRHGEAGVEAETFETINAIRKLCVDQNLPMAKVALAWIAAQPGVTSVIAGARNAEQARTNTEAASIELDSDLLAMLNTACDSLKSLFGTNLDPWQGESRIR